MTEPPLVGQFCGRIAPELGTPERCSVEGPQSMQSNVATTEKRIVNQLSFGQKTAKRVTWEAFEFEIVGPQQIEVTNASYGFEKHDHRYIVTVEDRGGLFFPDRCECPADEYNDYACKHRVACAIVGGPVVLGAAMAYTSDNTDQSDPTTMADKLRTDGGTEGLSEANTPPESHTYDRPEDCECIPLIDDEGLPCWPCKRDGFETPNPDRKEESA